VVNQEIQEVQAYWKNNNDYSPAVKDVVEDLLELAADKAVGSKPESVRKIERKDSSAALQEKIDRRNELLQRANKVTSSPTISPNNSNSMIATISSTNNVSSNNSNISIDRKISKVENSPMTPKTQETVRPAVVSVVPPLPVPKPEFDLDFTIPDMDNDVSRMNDQDEDMVFNDNNLPQDNNLNDLDKNAAEFFSKLPEQNSIFPSKLFSTTNASTTTTTNTSTPNQSANKNTTSSANSTRPSIIDFFPDRPKIKEPTDFLGGSSTPKYNRNSKNSPQTPGYLTPKKKYLGYTFST